MVTRETNFRKAPDCAPEDLLNTLPVFDVFELAHVDVLPAKEADPVRLRQVDVSLDLVGHPAAAVEGDGRAGSADVVVHRLDRLGDGDAGNELPEGHRYDLGEFKENRAIQIPPAKAVRLGRGLPDDPLQG